MVFLFRSEEVKRLFFNRIIKIHKEFLTMNIDVEFITIITEICLTGFFFHKFTTIAQRPSMDLRISV